MKTESSLQVSVKSVLEDVLQQQQGNRTRNSRRFDESSLRRFEAAKWLRKTIGVIGGKDLPAEPSEEAFRHGLRSGIILCNVLNKVQPGSVPKVVEGACDPLTVADGAALSAFQYFENVRNFLAAIEEMRLPSFEASDFEEGGKSSRIVNCVLALKSYSEWKQNGAIGSWKYSANSKPSCFGSRKTVEPFMKSLDSLSAEQPDFIDEVTGSITHANNIIFGFHENKNFFFFNQIFHLVSTKSSILCNAIGINGYDGSNLRCDHKLIVQPRPYSSNLSPTKAAPLPFRTPFSSSSLSSTKTTSNFMFRQVDG